MQKFSVDREDLIAAVKNVSAATKYPTDIILHDRLYFLIVEAENAGLEISASQVVHHFTTSTKSRSEAKITLSRSELLEGLTSSVNKAAEFYLRENKNDELKTNFPNNKKIKIKQITPLDLQGTKEKGTGWVDINATKSILQIAFAIGDRTTADGNKIFVDTQKQTKKKGWNIFAGNQTNLFAWITDIPISQSNIQRPRFGIHPHLLAQAWKTYPNIEGSETWIIERTKGDMRLLRGGLAYKWASSKQSEWSNLNYTKISELYCPANMPLQAATSKKKLLAALADIKDIEDSKHLWIFCDGQNKLSFGQGRKKGKADAAIAGGKWAIKVDKQNFTKSVRAVNTELLGLFYHDKSECLLVVSEDLKYNVLHKIYQKK